MVEFINLVFSMFSNLLMFDFLPPHGITPMLLIVFGACATVVSILIKVLSGGGDD